MWGGALCDKLGIVRFIALISVVVLFTSLSLLVRTVTAQIMVNEGGGWGGGGRSHTFALCGR